ncbi:eukaryotic-like serine/threonine-protein kinase [Myxococcaceae bacterium]|jgi:tetratricopeptide (TPR) repeat protein|nr:eukaryotic-like serine/threonine-protein kinase [Myxococcaceae bacterium]
MEGAGLNGVDVSALLVVLRGIATGGGVVLLVLGACGLVLTHAPEVAAAPLSRVFEALASGLYSLAGVVLSTDRLVAELRGPIAPVVLLGAGVALLVGSSRIREVPGRAPAAEPTVDRKTRRRAEREADALVKEGRLREAGEIFLECGRPDRAVESFAKGEEFVRAAEVRHDQNRFAEAADFFERAGRFESAGTIFSQQGDFARAAEAYVKAGRLSVAAEMFEKLGNHERAGDAYAQVGFHRHAAQVYVKCQQWEKAASSLEEVIAEEGQRLGTGQDQRKQKELRTLILQAGKLFEQAGRLDRALAVLEKGSCSLAAAEMAVRLGEHARAAELFRNAGQPLRAAEALEQLGESREAARLRGEYHRDQGEDEEAARWLEDSGDFVAAGDLLRKLERYAEAASCYEKQGDSAGAAEMFRLAGDPLRAARAYEHAELRRDAAECYGEAGDFRRQAALLAAAGELLQAGEIFHREGLDDEAIKVLQQVEPGGAGFGHASALLGAIFRAKGMHSLSIKKLKQAIGDAPLSRENVDAWYALANVHELAEDWSEAVEIYEKILVFDYHYQDVETRLAAARARAVARGASELSGSRPRVAMGAQSGRYQILGELGRGGMGIVFRARDTVLDRIVAYKVLPDALKENPQALRNFLREAKSAAQLNHPNIVTVYDAGEQDGRYYIAMEYVDGTTLKEILRRKKVISANGVLHVLVQLSEALAYAHEKKIVHRDVKTANTMWTREKKAKIMDFGLAKVVEEVRNHTTLVSGTPYYMSPEQTLGRNVDHRTDIYSLGVTVFELATGKLPFREGNVPYHHVHTPPPDPRSLASGMPELLARIILRCLQKDPDLRYQSTREILAEVRSLGVGRPERAGA